MAKDRSIGLMASDENGFELALVDAVLAGPSGEDALVRALSIAPDDRRVSIAAALGESHGEKGDAVLRSMALDTGRPTDERCAAIVALAKRSGVHASDVFAALLIDGDAAVARYSRRSLGCFGDDRSWNEVLMWLDRNLSKRPARSSNGPRALTLSDQSVNLAAIVYLARHADSPDRRHAVIALIRSRWEGLSGAEQDWVRRHWPACEPGYEGSGMSPHSSPEELAAWLRKPLYAPLYRT